MHHNEMGLLNAFGKIIVGANSWLRLAVMEQPMSAGGVRGADFRESEDEQTAWRGWPPDLRALRGNREVVVPFLRTSKICTLLCVHALLCIVWQVY